MLCTWKKVGKGLYTTTAFGREGISYHLNVERLPSRGWDWTIWRAGGSGATTRYGYTTSAKSAMAAAEDAAAEKVSRRHGSPDRRGGRAIVTPRGLLFPYWSISD